MKSFDLWRKALKLMMLRRYNRPVRKMVDNMWTTCHIWGQLLTGILPAFEDLLVTGPNLTAFHSFAHRLSTIVYRLSGVGSTTYEKTSQSHRV